MLYMIFQYCLEPVLIQLILIGFEAILDKALELHNLSIIKKSYMCQIDGSKFNRINKKSLVLGNNLVLCGILVLKPCA